MPPAVRAAIKDWDLTNVENWMLRDASMSQRDIDIVISNARNGAALLHLRDAVIGCADPMSQADLLISMFSEGDPKLGKFSAMMLASMLVRLHEL